MAPFAASIRPSLSRSVKPAQRGQGYAASYRRWALAGAVGGAGMALVYFAPAAWLAAGIAQASSGHVLLSDARGTVWNGSAQLVLTGGLGSNDAAALPDRVQWALRPTWSGIQANVLPVCCSAAPLRIAASPRWGGAHMDIRDLQMNLPAQLLSGLGTPWNTLSPQGQLVLTADMLAVEWQQGRAQLDGNAILNMTDISSRLSTLRPLGDYRLSLIGGAVPSVQLQTVQGALQLTGSGEWAGSRIRFSGEASAAPEREAALTNLLNIIGRRQGAKSLISLG
jgi:general secretion pathway protein N